MLRILAAGPGRLESGPVGRMSKRGLCRALPQDEDRRCRAFEITPSGLAVLEKLMAAASRENA